MRPHVRVLSQGIVCLAKRKKSGGGDLLGEIVVGISEQQTICLIHLLEMSTGAGKWEIKTNQGHLSAILPI